MLVALAILFLVATVAALYVLILRPVLRRWSVLKGFWAATDDFELSVWGKIVALFDGLKIKLLARLMWVPTLIVYLYDYAVPYLAGIDVTPLMQNAPAWVHVAINFGAPVIIPILIDWARSTSSSPQPPGA